MEFAGFHLQHHPQEESDQCTTSATPPEYIPSISQSWIPGNVYHGTSGFLVDTHSKELGRMYAVTDSLRNSTGQALFGFHDAKSFTQQPASVPKLCEIMNGSSKSFDDSRNSPIPMSEPQDSPSYFSTRRGTRKEEFLPAENFCRVQNAIDGAMALIKRHNVGGVSSISNLSTLDMTSSLVSSSLGLTSQMLHMHAGHSGSSGPQLCNDTFGLNEESISLSHGNMHGRENSSSNSSNNIISSCTSEVAVAKRPNNCSRLKETDAKANKKSRTSCPTLKVRKEKLGDRIQTLQRLVAPFGKTSTASVLTEAIGYVHFLHEQIQTLSIPYMKSAQSKPSRMVQLGSKKEDSIELFKPDLRSRGLCLVPLSYVSFVHRCF